MTNERQKTNSYPDINSPNFYDDITKIFKKYKISKKRKSLEEICFPKKFEFQIPQKFLAAYINPKTPYKSILIYHKIGSGKTCTAINIAEQWKYTKEVKFVLPAFLIGNFRSELRSYCTDGKYITDEERENLKIHHPSSPEYKQIIEKSDERINKYYNIFSYNKFIEALKKKKLSLTNTILIIDEIQNMISDHGVYYNILYKAIKKAPKDLIIVLLSATPIFDKPSQIALTLNLLRLPKPLPIGTEFNNTFLEVIKKHNGEKSYKIKNMDLFKSYIKGYISYYRGAPPYVFPEERKHYVKCKMNDFQYKSYLTVLAAELVEKEKDNKKKSKKSIKKIFNEGEILDLPNNFFIGTRIISNIAFPNKNIYEHGFESLTDNDVKPDKLKKYSIKFYKILKKINRVSGTVFVYSSFKEFGGIKSLARVLDGNGYKNYAEYGEGKKRYVLWTGNEKPEFKNLVKEVFNSSENVKGGRIKIVMGSPALREGVSFYRIKQVHILEPHWNNQRIQQVVGRAIRFCSHKDLPPEERYIDLYIYLAVHPDIKETVDQYILKLAFKKDKLIKQFEQAMKEAAIDCELFKNANVYKGEEDIKCEK